MNMKWMTKAADLGRMLRKRSNLLVLGAGWLLLFLYFLLLTGKPVFAGAAGMISLFFVPYFDGVFVKRRKGRVLLEFQDFLFILNSHLKAGKSLDNAMAESRNSLNHMYGEDTLFGKGLEKVLYYNKIGVPYEKGFQLLEDQFRIGILGDFAGVIRIARTKGGAFNQILTETSNILSERMETEREIGTMLAKQALEVKILRVIPFGMLLALRFLYPEMITFLTDSPLGIATFLFVIGLFALAFVVSNKFMEVIWE